MVQQKEMVNIVIRGIASIKRGVHLVWALKLMRWHAFCNVIQVGASRLQCEWKLSYPRYAASIRIRIRESFKYEKPKATVCLGTISTATDRATCRLANLLGLYLLAMAATVSPACLRAHSMAAPGPAMWVIASSCCMPTLVVGNLLNP